MRPSWQGHRSSFSDAVGNHTNLDEESSPNINHRKVVARVSVHTLRLEREFQLANSISKSSDPECKHIIRPIEFIRLPPKPGQKNLVVFIFEAPGANYLRDVVEFGPNAYKGVATGDEWEFQAVGESNPEQLSLQIFLDFAIGATSCCEIIHRGNQLVHGELRGDAFHFNKDTGVVRLVNFGSGARSFENGLTSTGWISLSREAGIEYKLQFVAPEQTGRLLAAPDARTDIYSLGVLFWTMLSGTVPFEGETALDIMQSVLSRRIAPLTSRRNDLPTVLSSVIQKMTQKNIDERYKSASGLKHDLISVQKMLGECDVVALDSFRIATKDVSSFFTVPSKLIGRDKERIAISTVLDKHLMWRRKPHSLRKGMSSLSSHSSISDPKVESFQLEDIMSDSTSSRGSDGNNVESQVVGSGTGRQSSKRSSGSHDLITDDTSGTKFPLHPKGFHDGRVGAHSTESSLHRSTSGRSGSQDLQTSLLRKAHKIGNKERCEVVTVCGAAGLGKSSLVHNISSLARSRGYFASAKFDQAKKAPFDPILKLLSSLFRQIFSESDVNTDFHSTIRALVGPVWNHLYTYLDLPASLFDEVPSSKTLLANRNSLQLPSLRRNSSPLVQCGGAGNTASDWLRSGGSTKASKFVATFLDVLGFLAMQQFLVLCVDDLQFADPESLELIQSIVSRKLPLVLILTYREDSVLPSSIRSVLATSTNIELSPFDEDETSELVAETLCRDREYVVPLVAVIQEKTRGNPFFIKEMLDVCYRTGCIYYSWTDSNWHYSLDKIFNEFESQIYGSQIGNDFVAKRLQGLSYPTRVLLSWASLIGNTFSFSLVKSLCNLEENKTTAGKSDQVPSYSNF